MRMIDCYKTTRRYDAPDFLVAMAYNIEPLKITSMSEIPKALNAMWRPKDKAFILQVNISTEVNVYPQIIYGEGLSAMEPLKNLHQPRNTQLNKAL